MGDFIDQSDLEATLGPATIVSLFDDDNDGEADPAAVESCISDAEGEVRSYMVGDWPNPLPNQASTDKLLRRCALDFAICFAYERHPEYARSDDAQKKHADLWKRAVERMQRIQAAVQIPPDLSKTSPPATLSTKLTDDSKRMIISGSDGTFNGGDF